MLPSIQRPPTHASQPGRVLLFEPDALVRLVLTELFSDEGIDVVKCASLGEVEDVLVSCPGSVAMVDAPCRPGARNPAVDQAIARIARAGRLILSSASRCDKLLADLDLVGAVDVLDKPFDLDTVLSLVSARLLDSVEAAA
jgi:DNA-binding NtrC family response regulator